NLDIETGRGVKVNRYLETNIPNIYAIGDCAEQHEAIGSRRTIEAVWYTGRMMGETVAQTICGNKIEYKPGHWFNSAKFFDIEYQTYGWVWAQPKDNEARFYWEHESGKKCIHINYDKSTHEFIGINTFGIRMRHEFFDKMLTEKQSVEYVLEHLADANFDPEFYKLHEKEIVEKFNMENDTNIQLKKKSWKRIFQSN
ncbi:MAG: FAD-dependent oxidoreductase, partial [Bacteroidetes bacterium]